VTRPGTPCAAGRAAAQRGLQPVRGNERRGDRRPQAGRGPDCGLLAAGRQARAPRRCCLAWPAASRRPARPLVAPSSLRSLGCARGSSLLQSASGARAALGQPRPDAPTRPTDCVPVTCFSDRLTTDEAMNEAAVWPGPGACRGLSEVREVYLPRHKHAQAGGTAPACVRAQATERGGGAGAAGVGRGAGGDGPPGGAGGNLARRPLARADRVHVPLPPAPAAVRRPCALPYPALPEEGVPRAHGLGCAGPGC